MDFAGQAGDGAEPGEPEETPPGEPVPIYQAYIDRAEKQLEDLRRPRLENTARRIAQACSRSVKANRLERIVSMCRAIQAMPEVPDDLRRLGWLEFYDAAYTQLSHGSYGIVDTFEYGEDKGPICQALRALVDPITGKASQDQAQTLAKLQLSKIPGFFPTPSELAGEVVSRADIQPGHAVLEPSAGKGDLAELVESAGGSVHCVEIRGELCELLRSKFPHVHQGDFLEWEPGRQFDRVVMNPPFENGQSLDHVRRAYDLLAPGGRLVAIVPGSVMYRDDRKHSEFRQWLLGLGAVIEPVEGKPFAKGFKQTTVSVYLIELDRQN